MARAADPGRLGSHRMEIVAAVPELGGASRAGGKRVKASVRLTDGPAGDAARRQAG